MAKHSKKQEVLEDEALLEFKVGPFRFCASALDVEAIISPPDMLQVPLSTDIVAGCFIHQNRTATVLSMHQKFGLPFTHQENETHIILATVNNGLKGFWVDQAFDVVQLNTLESIADYSPHERKAYSNFLIRNDDIILQTSFQRLYKCARSRLYWATYSEANKAVAISDNDTAVIKAKNVATAEGVNIENEVTRITANNQQSGTSKTDTNVIAAKSAANNGYSNTAYNASPAANNVSNNLKRSSDLASQKQVANADFTTNTQTEIKHKPDGGDSSPKKTISNKLTQPYKNSRVLPSTANPYVQNSSGIHTAGSSQKTLVNKSAFTEGTAPENSDKTFNKDQKLSAAASHAYSPSRRLSDAPEYSAFQTGDTNNRVTSSSHERRLRSDTYTSEDEPEDKKHSLLPLAAALLALCALGLGSMYLLDNGTGPAIKNPNKVTGIRESSSSMESGTTDYTSKQSVAASSLGTDKNESDTTTSITNSADTASLVEQQQSEQGMDTANLIESTQVAEPLEKDTLNEINQEAVAIPSTNPRVIELHVNEQPDTPLAAITNHEPTTRHQYNVLGTQEFTHVVIKGDTLWHITRRYLGNPFRYPELAESSQINNPHLIYPGDVIRITVTRNNGQQQ